MTDKSREAGDIDSESEESERVHTVKDYREQLVELNRRRERAQASLYEGEITIGRLKDNDIQINSEFVSRAHARIVISADRAVIEDVSSKNGIVVDSTSVDRHVFSDGDMVILGTTRLT
ncbi:MAG: FHA domain-containing protein [Candidatus Rariloculaceae bacterium]